MKNSGKKKKILKNNVFLAKTDPDDNSANASGNKRPNKAVPWGRAASEFRPGIFIRTYLGTHDEACAADIYHALSEDLVRMNQYRIEIGEKPIRRPNYSSFNRYMHWFAILKLIEKTGRTADSAYEFLQKRVFYRITDKGRSEALAWQDPISVAHPEFR